MTCCGHIYTHRKKVNIGTVVVGQRVTLKEVDDGIWLVSFIHYDLGQINLEQITLQAIDNSLGKQLKPMCPVRSVTYVFGPAPSPSRINHEN